MSNHPPSSYDPGATCRVGEVTLHADDEPQTRREKLARIVLDAMYQFVGLLDVDGTTLEINRAALDGAGIDLDTIRGRPFWEARWFQVSRETTEQQRDFVRRARDGEFVRCDMEIYGQAAGDQTIVVDFSLLPVRDGSGAVAFLLAEGRNITAKKRAEAEIARKNAELQSLLDRIRQLDQLRSDLFANVSHELRTPLALILGPTEDLLEQGHNLSQAQRRQLQIVQRNAATLLKHVNDLLDLARLDARKMDMQYARVDLAALVRVVADQFHAVAPARAVSYVVSTPESLQAVVDPDKAEKVLLNLLSNAFKFTPVGGRVRCVLERLGADRCLLSVQDSGPGVPPPLRQAIFERFRQLQQGTTRDHGGTGLGLAIAKEFVDLHQGSIGVSEAPGGGSLFQVELPLVPPAQVLATVGALPGEPPRRNPAMEGTLAELAPPEDEAQSGAADDERPTLLVVEDNAEMRRFIRDALAGEFRVTAVEDGQAGLERAIADPPDLVITDLMLPRLGGDRLVELMRTHPSLVDVPVLVLSAKDDQTLRARLLAQAAQDYLSKPFSAQELRARASNLATMKRARDVLRRELASQSSDLTQLTRHLIANRRALQESEYRWWTIYEHSPVGIALIDASGRIRTANPAFATMLGYSAEELRTCTLQRISPVEDRAPAQERVDRMLAGELRDYHVQRRYLRKDGELVWANTSVALIPDDGGAERMLVVVAEDITERKRAEQGLARARAELAQVMRASTLGELAASIAHEVNQPLAAIVANGHASLRWLNARPPNEAEARSAVDRIIRDANRAGDVITRIRRFLQRGDMQRDVLDMNVVVADVLALVRAEAQARRVNLRFAPEPVQPAVAADRVQVQQVLLNLVMNALEAMSRGNGFVRHVVITLSPQGDEALQVNVCDNGPGIDPAVQGALFDPFQTTKPGGMGMGLAISRSIVEAHGGRLWVAHNQGPGVTFSFTLPVDTTQVLP